MTPGNSFTLPVYGKDVYVIIGAIQPNHMIPISAQISRDLVFHRFLAFDPTTLFLTVSDDNELHRLLRICRGGDKAAMRTVRLAMAVRTFLFKLTFGITDEFIKMGDRGALFGLAAIASLALLVPGIAVFVLTLPLLFFNWQLTSSDEKRYYVEMRQFTGTIGDRLRDSAKSLNAQPILDHEVELASATAT